MYFSVINTAYVREIKHYFRTLQPLSFTLTFTWNPMDFSQDFKRDGTWPFLKVDRIDVGYVLGLEMFLFSLGEELKVYIPWIAKSSNPDMFYVWLDVIKEN